MPVSAMRKDIPGNCIKTKVKFIDRFCQTECLRGETDHRCGRSLLIIRINFLNVFNHNLEVMHTQKLFNNND